MFKYLHTQTHWLLILVMLTGMSGCSVLSWFTTANNLEEISLEALPDANQKLPVAIDIVWVGNLQQLNTLSSLTGPQWFQKKQQYLRLYGSSMAVNSLEPVPGSNIVELELPDDSEDYIQVILFADYLDASGQSLALIGHFNELHITLHNNTYQLEELDP